MIVPYYEHAGITIYCSDCRNLFGQLQAHFLALDPPYGTNQHGGYGRRQLGLKTIANDADTSLRDTILEWWGHRAAIVFGSPRRPEPPGQWDYRLVWDKGSPGLGSPWRWQHEMVYARGEWSNQPGVPSIFRISAGNSMRERLHPHEKPVPLMCALLAGTEGTILDLTMGSGSTLEAAKRLGRNAIGVDLEEQNCEIAAKRLAQEVLFAAADGGAP